MRKDERAKPCCTIPEIVLDEDAIAEEARLANIKAEEESRICMTLEHEVTINKDLETDENTEWIQASGWARWFRHKSFHLLVAAAVVLPPDCPTSLHLEPWHGVKCSSSQKAEKTLGILVRAAFEVIDCCLASLQRAPRILRC